MTNTIEAIGALLKRYRVQQGLTREQLATMTKDDKITASVITNIEMGRKSDVSVRELFAFSEALQLPITALLVDCEQPFQGALVYDSGILGQEMIDWVALVPHYGPGQDPAPVNPSGTVISATHERILEIQRLWRSILELWGDLRSLPEPGAGATASAFDALGFLPTGQGTYVSEAGYAERREVLRSRIEGRFDQLEALGVDVPRAMRVSVLGPSGNHGKTSA